MRIENVLRIAERELGDLLAEHERTASLEDFERYAEDPEGFFRDVLRCAPWSAQVEMAEHVRDNPRTVVITGNGLGKDWITGRIALWWIYARRGFVILTAPTERQVKQITMREVRKAFAAAPELPGSLYAMELRVDEAGECGLLAFTSDNADRLTGFHHPRLLICVTEGQGVAEEAYEAAQACATAPGNRIFVYGNPTRPTGSFYRYARGGNWTPLKVTASSHPNVITGRIEIPGAVSREWIELMRDEYGESSPIYRSRVLAEFPEESLEGLVRRDWLRAAFARTPAYDLTTPPLLSLDVARFGPDASVLSVLSGATVVEMVTWRGASITETVDRVKVEMERVAQDWKVKSNRARNIIELPPRVPRLKIVVDEPGLGGGVIDILRKERFDVEAFNGGSAADSNDGRFLNKRAESHWNFRRLLEEGNAVLPNDTELEEEALAVEWQINTAGKIQIVSKDVIREALGRSPDKLDSVINGLYYSAPAPSARSTGWGSSQWRGVYDCR